MYASAHTPLDEETIKLTSFSSGDDNIFAFIRGFYGLKGLSSFFTKQVSTFFKTLIEQRFDLVCLDDLLLLSKQNIRLSKQNKTFIKEHVFHLIEHLHCISTNITSNWLQTNPFSCFLRLNSLDMK